MESGVARQQLEKGRVSNTQIRTPQEFTCSFERNSEPISLNSMLR